MASQFKKTVSTFSRRNLREGRLFPLDAKSLRNVRTKLARPLRNVGAALVLFTTSLPHLFQSLVPRPRRRRGWRIGGGKARRRWRVFKR